MIILCYGVTIREKNTMPNPNIRCNDPTRIFVQYELPELKKFFYQALWTNDIDKINEIDYELSHRSSSRAIKFRAGVRSKLDNI